MFACFMSLLASV
uniref:Uncharacterized protein n=1 Tax=Arundo donax TaxID=35708 RepID=A0A0A9GWP8_ARUDO